MQNIVERIKKTPLVFDGAMGTMIYQRGVFLNACYDELCLTQAKLISGIHQEYIEAGAEVLETNSFGANRIKLAAYGLVDKVEAINRAAVQLARDAAGGNAFVAGSIGPCYAPGVKVDAAAASKMEEALVEQIGFLVAAGVDLLSIESFHDVAQLQAVAAIARRSGVPVLASFTLEPTLEEGDGRLEADIAGRLDADPNIDIIGLNCGRGPADLFQPVKHVVKATSKPVVAMPNAGGPREVGGRMLYLNSPEYFTEFCKRYIELGARGIGGCCGTTPAHIRMAARAVKSMSGVKEYIRVAASPAVQAPGATGQALAGKIAFKDKSAFAAKLAAGTKVTSVELLPPQNYPDLPRFIERCRLCQNAGVDAINLPDGPRASARMSVVSTSVLMQQQKLVIEPIPHFCCRDRNLIGMQSDLLGGFALGLKTWLFITGDPPKLGNYPDATGVFDLDAIGLAGLASNLNNGYDAAGQPIGKPTAMVTGVGANPLAVEMEREIERYFRKVDAGAEFAITQPIFDVEALLRFIERISKYSKTIPVIAGIYPLTSFKNADFMNKHVPGVTVPRVILDRLAKWSTKEDGLREGVEIACEIRRRLEGCVQGFQVSAPLGRVESALTVLA